MRICWSRSPVCPDSKLDTYRVYSVVGNQKNSSGQEITSLATALPIAVAPGLTSGTHNPDQSQLKTLSGGLTIGKVTYNTGSDFPVGAFGFFTTYQIYGGSGNLNSGSIHADVFPIGGSALNQTSGQGVDKINGNSYISNRNPSGGIKVCLLSGGTNQHATITVGGSGNGQLTVTSTITNGNAISDC